MALKLYEGLCNINYPPTVPLFNIQYLVVSKIIIYPSQIWEVILSVLYNTWDRVTVGEENYLERIFFLLERNLYKDLGEL